MTTSRRAGAGHRAGASDAPPAGFGWGTPSLALGAVAVGTAWLGWPGLVLGLVAAVLGFVGARRAFSDPTRSGGAALGGFVLGVVGLVWGTVVVWPTVFGTGAYGEGLTLDECMAQAVTQQEQRMCATQHLEEYRERFPGRDQM